jgi:hypothetical protein
MSSGGGNIQSKKEERDSKIDIIFCKTDIVNNRYTPRRRRSGRVLM